ncbi:APOPT family protein CG14806, mitochondrial [Ceratitis capitata]|uniref:APOPT family protein CG14806, mitochondrial n=1 Tax=Ceratitis capitata TaxID=7213 RepID=UPI000329AE23|nr:APOPT family protein CG14806, mitochondrial [Ceratitis capitata]
MLLRKVKTPIRNFSDLYYICRYGCTQHNLKEKPDPTKVSTDYVGPADKLSNIRLYVRHVAKNETDLQSRLRQKQEEVEKWNHEFWARHNESFYLEREDFIKTSMDGVKNDDSADKMSEFYKSFLDKNWKTHFHYNFTWYSKNLEMLTLSFRVYAEWLLKKLKNKD